MQNQYQWFGRQGSYPSLGLDLLPSYVLSRDALSDVGSRRGSVSLENLSSVWAEKSKRTNVWLRLRTWWYPPTTPRLMRVLVALKSEVVRQ